MQTPWGGLAVFDAHVHSFSRRFYALLASQKGPDASAASVCETPGWTLPPAEPEELAAHWAAELDRHGVERSELIASVPDFVHCGVLSVGVRRKLGLPSLFDLRYSNPVQIHAIALRYPSLPFKAPLDLRAVFARALAVTGPGRLLFGSDSSFFPRASRAAGSGPSSTGRSRPFTPSAPIAPRLRRSWAKTYASC